MVPPARLRLALSTAAVVVEVAVEVMAGVIIESANGISSVVVGLM